MRIAKCTIVMSKFAIMYFIIFILCYTISLASEINCPQSVIVEQKIVNLPESWNITYEKNIHKLASVTFYDGHPEEMASLVNDGQLQNKNEWIAIWHFQPNSERGYWMSCSYSYTNAVLSKRLPSKTSECRVFYEKGTTLGVGNRVIKKMECK